MNTPEWRPITLPLEGPNAEKKIFEFYPSRAPWTMVLDYVQDCVLKIEASGLWTVPQEATTECGPDGSPFIPVADALTTEALPGMLIAKLGGGLAQSKPADIILAGSACVVNVDNKLGYSLFLGMNLISAKQPCFQSPPPAAPKKLTITIFEAKR